MDSSDGWNVEGIFQKYLHDYLVKNNMHRTAEVFVKETNADVCPVVSAIDSPQGFLAEWWSIFHDVYFHMQLEQVEETEIVSNEGKHVRETSQNPCFGSSKSGINSQNSTQFSSGHDSDSMLTQLSPKTCEGVHHKCVTRKVDAYSQTSSETKNTRGGTSKPQRNICKQASERQDKKKFVSMVNTSMASSTCAEPNTIGSESDLSSAPLKGWPLIGANHVHPRLGHQVLNSYLQSANYPRIDMPLSHSQQEIYAQFMESTQANALSSFPLTSNLDVLLRNRTSGKDGWDDEEKGIEDTIQMLFSQFDDHSNYTNVSYPLQQPSSSHEQNGHTDISLVQVGTLHASKGKLFSCSFSPNGKLLACAGNDKKVFLWNVDTSRYTSSLETHAHLITDVRFHPSSEFFATSSYDKTVQIWDTADCRNSIVVESCRCMLQLNHHQEKPSKSLFALSGHNDHVMSLDFHPRKMDLLCSSDCNDEIRFWDMKDYNCLRVFKGAIKQVRFQPQLGRLLATASGNGVNIFNVETGDFEFDLKGHQSEVRSICWDVTGNYIASVSEESVRLWSILSGGRCIYELQSKGHNFQSCTFHPGHPVLLIIGSYQFLGSWNPTLSSTVNTIQAHCDIISSLASSPSTGLIASASHDQSVKLWI